MSLPKAATATGMSGHLLLPLISVDGVQWTSSAVRELSSSCVLRYEVFAKIHHLVEGTFVTHLTTRNYKYFPCVWYSSYPYHVAFHM